MLNSRPHDVSAVEIVDAPFPPSDAPWLQYTYCAVAELGGLDPDGSTYANAFVIPKYV